MARSSKLARFNLNVTDRAKCVASVLRITSPSLKSRAWTLIPRRVSLLRVLQGKYTNFLQQAGLANLIRYIFIGHEGDPKISSNPDWSKEGSYLVFRQLDQKVPEFEKYAIHCFLFSGKI